MSAALIATLDIMANTPTPPASAPKGNPSTPITSTGDPKANGTPTRGGVK